MKTNKKAISLIVLVITIIVLAILAAAVIIALSNANIIEQANDAVNDANMANYAHAAQLEYAAYMAASAEDKEGQTASEYIENKLLDSGVITKDVAKTLLFSEAGGVSAIQVGDVDLNGKIDATDRVILSRVIDDWEGYSDKCLYAADTNADGVYNEDDDTILSRHLANHSGYETLPYTGEL